MIQSGYDQMIHRVDGFRVFVTAANVGGCIIILVVLFINKFSEKSGLKTLQLMPYTLVIIFFFFFFLYSSSLPQHAVEALLHCRGAEEH